MTVRTTLYFCRASLAYFDVEYFTADNVVDVAAAFYGKPNMAVAAAFFCKVGAVVAIGISIRVAMGSADSGSGVVTAAVVYFGGVVETSNIV